MLLNMLAVNFVKGYNLIIVVIFENLVYGYITQARGVVAQKQTPPRAQRQILHSDFPNNFNPDFYSFFNNSFECVFCQYSSHPSPEKLFPFKFNFTISKAIPNIIFASNSNHQILLSEELFNLSSTEDLHVFADSTRTKDGLALLCVGWGRESSFGTNPLQS